jgi:hypothetical protein
MRVQFVYTPEGGSPRKWEFDPANPAWDLAYVTESETGWPWEEFMDKLAHGSHIALRAFVYAFRKRDEPKLSIGAVMVTVGEIDLVEVETPPASKPEGSAEGEGEA